MKFIKDLFKREVKGWLILILNTGYEIIPNERCQIGATKHLYFELQDNYWYQNKIVKYLPLYKKDIVKIETLGYNISEKVYYKRLGYDDILKYGRKRIINLIPRINE